MKHSFLLFGYKGKDHQKNGKTKRGIWTFKPTCGGFRVGANLEPQNSKSNLFWLYGLKKKQKGMKETKKNYLSNLPDEMKLHILQFSTEDEIKKTRTLSVEFQSKLVNGVQCLLKWKMQFLYITWTT